MDYLSTHMMHCGQISYSSTNVMSLYVPGYLRHNRSVYPYVHAVYRVSGAVYRVSGAVYPVMTMSIIDATKEGSANTAIQPCKSA